MKKVQFADEKMVAILREADRIPVADVGRKQKVSEQTIYVWRRGGSADNAWMTAVEMVPTPRKPMRMLESLMPVSEIVPGQLRPGDTHCKKYILDTSLHTIEICHLWLWRCPHPGRPAHRSQPHDTTGHIRFDFAQEHDVALTADAA